MATVNYLYRSSREKANLVLRLLFRHNDTDYALGAKTKIEVTKKYWQKDHKRKFPRDLAIVNAQADINKQIATLTAHILKNFKNTNPKFINKNWLQKQIDNFYDPSQQISKLPKELIKYIDFFITDRQNDLSPSTIKKYKVIKQLLIRFETKAKTTLLISNVDASFKKDFEDYCIANEYAPNTIARAIRAIKTICNHAKYQGLETSHQLDFLKAKNIKVENTYLNPSDIDKLLKIKKGKLTPTQEHARDWLIISCYTGQRISDFMRFNKSMLRQEKNKKGNIVTLIEFTQKKTGKLMTVPLKQEVIDILDKRDGNFPTPISDSKYNKQIKQVCRIAKINEKVSGSKKVKNDDVNSKFKYRKETDIYEKWELVTSHIGRRSFATNFYGDIPTSYLINVTGHSTERMFLNYIGKSNKDLALELTNYF